MKIFEISWISALSNIDQMWPLCSTRQIARGVFSEPFIIREIGTNDKFLGLDNGSALLLAGAIGGLSGGLGVNGSFSGAVTSGLSTAGSVSLIRGGIITQGTQAAIDQVRIGKFLLSPRGLIWN